MDKCNDFDAINASYDKSELKALDNFARSQNYSGQALEIAIRMAIRAGQAQGQAIGKSEAEKRDAGRTLIQKKSFSFLLTQLGIREFLKIVFFSLVLALFFAALFFSRDLIHTLSLRDNIDAAALISAVVGGLSVLIGLPMVIANYLFNKEESTAIIGLIQQVILSDRNPGKDGE